MTIYRHGLGGFKEIESEENMKYICKLLIVFALLGAIMKVNASAQAGLRIKIAVKNTTQYAAEKFPVTLGCPLPKSKYWDIRNFALVDKSGQPVLAQFEVLNRNWATDNSLRHIAIHFLADVPASGESVYYLIEGNAISSSSLKTTELTDRIIIDTGKIKVVIKKKGFNLFDEVWLDTNKNSMYEKNERVILSDPNNGGILTDRNGKLQKSSDAPFMGKPFKVELEENGPVRSVIRLETYTHSRSYNEQFHGYKVRLYFYSGLSLVRVRYTLKNSDYTTSIPRPLYFDDFSLILKLNFAPGKILYGYDLGTVELGPDMGSYLYQKKHDQFVVNTEDGKTIMEGQKADGWIDLKSGEIGIWAMVRDFWQTWPNSLEYTSSNQIRIGLWPRFGQDWWWNKWDNGKTIGNSGLYWLDDMQEATKEVWFYFHSNKFMAENAKHQSYLIQYPPVASVPLSWYKQTSVTLDMGGKIPIDEELKSNESLLEILMGQQGGGRSEDWQSGVYMYGWFNYAGDLTRRGACNGGGVPESGARFIVTGHPFFYYVMRAKAMGELNGRPMWLSGYVYEKHQRLANLFFGYCWQSWRREEIEPYLEGTNNHNWTPRDLAHFWVYDLEEYYYYSADEMVRDWYEFIGEALAAPLLDRYAYRPDANRQTRSLGHGLAALIQAYRITGKPKFLEYAKRVVRTFRDRQIPYNGTFRVHPSDTSEAEAPFQMGYVARALINFLEEVGESDYQAYIDAWGVLQGIMEWNLNLANFTYYWKPGTQNQVSASSVTIADPQAWFYLNTGIPSFKKQLKWYIDNYRGNFDLRKWGWEGAKAKNPGDLFVGRLTNYLFKYGKGDTIPPPPVETLRAAKRGDVIEISWYPTVTSKTFHLRWSTRPIAKSFTTSIDSCNFWAARGIVPSLKQKPNGQIVATISASDLPKNKTVYFAVVAFDDSNNMSSVSNIAVLSPILGEKDTNKPISPKRFEILGNHPNPFQHKTLFRFFTTAVGKIEIRVYNLRGQLVKVLNGEITTAGYQSLKWDGTTLTGQLAPSGIYFYQVIKSQKSLGWGKILKIR